MIINISELGAICGKMSFEPKTKMLLLYWAKYDKQGCKKFLIENNIIEVAEFPSNTFTRLNRILQEELNQIVITENTKNIERLTDIATNSYKKQDTEASEYKISLFRELYKQKISQKLGSVSEKTVVLKQHAHRPKISIEYQLTPEITLKGVCDCMLDDDTIIEVKTRTKIENVRKNEYDLCQLFGYILGYNATKGKIVQRFQDQYFSSDEETATEYGIVDINEPKWNKKLKSTIKAIKLFNNEVYNLVHNGTTSWNIIEDTFQQGELPICTINNNNKVINKNNKYNKLISFLF